MTSSSHTPVNNHTQRGTLMIVTFVLAGGYVLHQLLQGGPTWLWLLLAVAVVIGFSFSSLTVVVTNSMFQAHFTPGWPSKSVPLAHIASVRAVRNPWYYGWGIRWTPHGPLYNVSGLDAVEIRTRDGKAFRIGTDEPEKLQRVLENALSRTQSQ